MCIFSGDRRGGLGRGSGFDRGHRHDPSGDRDPSGRDHRPSNLRKTAIRRGAVQPIERLHREAVSSSRHATCSGARPDTNNRLPTHNPVRDLQA